MILEQTAPVLGATVLDERLPQPIGLGLVEEVPVARRDRVLDPEVDTE